MAQGTMSDVPGAILAAVKRGASSGVTFSADTLVRVLMTEFRWTSAQVADLLRRLRQHSAPKVPA